MFKSRQVLIFFCSLLVTPTTLAAEVESLTVTFFDCRDASSFGGRNKKGFDQCSISADLRLIAQDDELPLYLDCWFDLEYEYIKVSWNGNPETDYSGKIRTFRKTTEVWTNVFTHDDTTLVTALHTWWSTDKTIVLSARLEGSRCAIK